MTAYTLRCQECGRSYDDDGLRLACDQPHEPSLLRTEYAARTLAVDPAGEGAMRYAGWLPLRSPTRAFGAPAIFQSAALNRELGMADLWIAFSGYWPQRGATLQTGTFKDIEATAVLGRLPRGGERLVIASAGNTALALASACAQLEVPVVVVVPEPVVSRLRLPASVAERIAFVTVAGGTYDDAIVLAKDLGGVEGFVFEGGVANVARRDGIATVLYAAAEMMGRLPAVYAQAIGSGAGAIAAYEAALRLRDDGRFGCDLPRLVLVQNAPAAPVYDAWRAGSRTLLTGPATRPGEPVALEATVLGVQAPPYAVVGGLWDALQACDGHVLTAENAEARAAREWFAELEGIDLEPAAGVALAGLRRALADGSVAADACVLLHLTGGGRRGCEAGWTAAPRVVATIARDLLGDTARLREALASVA